MSLKLDKAGWRRVAFGEVVTNSSQNVNNPEAEGIDRVIAMEHLDPGELRISRWGGLDRGASFTRRVRPGQTLFGKRRAYQRKAALATFDAITSGDILVFEADESQLLPELLPFLVQSDGFYDHALGTSAGSLSPRTNWKDLADYEFDLPSLEEQKRLADLLWALERHNESLLSDASLVAERFLLQRLIAPSVGPLRRIDSVGEVLMGRQRSPKYAYGDDMVPYLRVANIGDNCLRLNDVKSMVFTPAEQRKFAVLPGDILLSEGQSRELVGQSVLITELPRSMCFQNTLIRFRADSTLIAPDYAQAVFRACHQSGTFSTIASQTTSIAHLGIKRFSELEIPVPGLGAQSEYIKKLEAVTRASECNRRERNDLANLRSAIISTIFTGGA